MRRVIFHGRYIITRFLPATSFHDDRIIARGNLDGKHGQRQRVTVKYYSHLEPRYAHLVAALRLCEELGWPKLDSRGFEYLQTMDGKGYIFMEGEEPEK